MCRVALLVACFVGVLAVGYSAEVPVKWIKNGEMRNGEMVTGSADKMVESADDKMGENVPKVAEIDDAATPMEAREFAGATPMTAADVFKRMYVECIQGGSFACVKPKVLAFLSASMKKDVIPITENLAIEKSNKNYYPSEFKWSSATPLEAENFMERVDDFLASHELKLRIPKEILTGEMLFLVPKFLLKNIPSELRVPLSEDKNVGQERGFIKKIIIPFLLGLKLKASMLLPLALTLIALKTWKALTLGLLSIVLSGALVIFKFTKPKTVNYEVVHYPHHPAPVVHHQPVEHHGWEHQGYGRAADAQEMAYRGHQQ